MSSSSALAKFLKLEAIMRPGGQKLEMQFEQAEDILQKKYGEQDVKLAFGYDEAMNCIGASWECRDCIVQ